MPLINDGYELADLQKYSMQKLCDIVIVAQYLGSLNKEAISCMEELARRRAAGDPFNYEEVIADGVKKLPDFKINLKSKFNIGFDFSILRNIK